MRERGYYWIKDCGEWDVAYWDGSVFKIIFGSDVICIIPSACEEINETRVLNQ